MASVLIPIKDAWQLTRRRQGTVEIGNLDDENTRFYHGKFMVRDIRLGVSL